MIALKPGVPDASVEIVARLRAGEIVCMLGDRTMEGRSMAADFLGAPVRLPVGPFAVAAATGAPVVPVFVVKSGLLRFTFTACDTIRVAPHAREERDSAIAAGIRMFASRLDSVVRAAPWQWYNFYDFWA